MNSKDIAKIVGVSRSTVSRVINNYVNVPEETRQKVLNVIKEYNYVPHASARLLTGYKNRIIGLFIIDIVERKCGIKNRITKSPYYLEFTSSVIEAASQKGYKALVHIIHDESRYDEIKECFYNKTISGGIFIGENNGDLEIKKIIKDGYKVAIIDQDINLYNKDNKCIIVNSDNYTGAYNATKYLISLNHLKIAHITGDIKKFSAVKRLDGYKKALQDSNIPIKNEFIIFSEFIEEGGYNSAKKILSMDDKPTAIFTANDKIAIGAIKAIKEYGLKVPKDISIIGFDNIEESKYLETPLTTMQMELVEMAELATNNIIDSIENDTNFSKSYNVPSTLVVRKSCKNLNN